MAVNLLISYLLIISFAVFFSAPEHIRLQCGIFAFVLFLIPAGLGYKIGVKSQNKKWEDKIRAQLSKHEVD